MSLSSAKDLLGEMCQLHLQPPPILAAECVVLGSFELQEPLGMGFRLILTGIRGHSAGNTDIKPLCTAIEQEPAQS